MRVELLRQIAIDVNNAKLNGLCSRDVYAREIAFIESQLAKAGLTWEDLA